MMDAGAVFVAVALMMLANGGVLAVISADLPATLRPAAKYWQIGTLLIALGCAVFAFGQFLPRPIMLVLANGLITFGLSAYHASIRRFDGVSPGSWQAFPGLFVSAFILWFSWVHPDFQIRLAIVSLVWIGQMSVCLSALIGGPHGGMSLSRKILIGNFAVVLAYTLFRLVTYLVMNPGRDFTVETGASWLNLLSPIFMTLLPIVGTTAFLLMCSDKLRRQLEDVASTDYLTGLPNRRTLADQGKKRFRAAEEKGHGLAVAILDIDQFKAINDTYGHDVGDEILIAVANCLRGQAGPHCVVSRSGGEEFTILLDVPGETAAVEAIQRMRCAIEAARFPGRSIGIRVTVSGGIAVYNPDDRAFSDTIRRADRALYAAKTRGRNRIEIASRPEASEVGSSNESWLRRPAY